MVAMMIGLGLLLAVVMVVIGTAVAVEAGTYRGAAVTVVYAAPPAPSAPVAPAPSAALYQTAPCGAAWLVGRGAADMDVIPPVDVWR